MSCWDTSALLKLYLPEADSETFVRLAGTATQLTIAAITRYEAEATFRRKEAEGKLAAGDADIFQRQFDTGLRSGTAKSVALSSDTERAFATVVKKCLSETPPVFIRTNDALHIATALVDGQREFVTADARQRAAAVLMGLTVLP